MHRYEIATALSLVLGLLLTQQLMAAEPLRSGPQPGEKVTTTFEPLNITGEFAGEPHCLVCEHGLNPVAMLFARQLSEPVIQLLVAIDAAATKHKQHEMGAFVVFLSDREDLAPQLQKVARTHGLKHIVLSIDPPAGPEGFNVAADADLTVVLYNRHVVQANHAFAKGEFTEKAIPRVVADVPKILPTK